MKQSRLVAFVLLVTCVHPSCSCPRNSKIHQTKEGAIRFPLPRLQLTIRGQVAYVEVASSEEEREQGLMYRRWLAPDSGMLFVFGEDAIRSFWMKNTYLPLSIAFITSSGIITDIFEMSPEDTLTRYQSSVPVRFALEMNAGWFHRHGIKPRDTVQGLASLSGR